MMDVPGIDSDRVSAWLASKLPDLELPIEFSALTGGRSNLSCKCVDQRGAAYVLRRPPLVVPQLDQPRLPCRAAAAPGAQRRAKTMGGGEAGGARPREKKRRTCKETLALRRYQYTVVTGTGAPPRRCL